MKIPNILTIIRFLLIPVIAFLLYSKNPSYILLSILLFLIAITSDWLDGFIARKRKMISVFGTFFDPIVDKILVLTILFIFVDLKLIPLWIVLLLLFRELFVSGGRQVCSTPKRFIGSNWMGKSKFVMQTGIIIYTQIYLYLNYSGITSQFFNQTAVYYAVLIMTILSLIYAFIFLYWYRKRLV